VAGALDCNGYSTLVLGAGACLATRADFTLTVDKTVEKLGIPVINFYVMVRAELARARAREVTSVSSTWPSAAAFSFFTHDMYSF